MDLKTFVKETLTQIAEGVNEAKPIVAKTGSFIVDRKPSNFSEPLPSCICDDGFYHPVTKLDFDVALEASETQGSKSGIGVVVASMIGAGAKKEKSNTQNSLSRVSFSLYVAIQ